MRKPKIDLAGPSVFHPGLYPMDAAPELPDGLMLVGAHLEGHPAWRDRTDGGFFGSFVEAVDACLAALGQR